MAYNASPDPNDPKKNQNNNVSTGQAPAVGVGTGAPSQVPTQAPTGSGQFVNLSKYLDANKGAGSKMAGAIAQKGENQVNTLNTTLRQANTAIGGQVQAEKDRIANASGFAGQIGTDPNALANDPSKLAAVQQGLAGTTNTAALKSQAQQMYNPAQAQLQGVQNFANQTGNESGRFDLLRQTLGRPGYNAGQSKLDQLLVQSGGGGVLNNLQKQAAQQAAAGQAALKSGTEATAANISGIDPAAQAAQAQLKGALGTMSDPTNPDVKATGAMGGLQTDLQKAVAERQGSIKSANDLAAQARLLGVGNVYNDISGANVNEQTIASPEQLARYQALAKLSGQPANYLDATTAGTATNINPEQVAQLQATTAKQQQAILDRALGNTANPDVTNLPKIVPLMPQLNLRRR